jgi:hypothetical protein
VLVALMTVIGCVSSQTCGGWLPNAIPWTISVWLVRLTVALVITS